ncbi:MAG TPA: hypothetical protein DD727_09510, partial [Clostridiales bacterium]|nr:hypothetical protein [Clostridiales bacterium]
MRKEGADMTKTQKTEQPLCILIAAGGTAGHVNPGIAVADALSERNPGIRIIFAGTSKGLENDLVPRAGYVLCTIRSRGF